MGDKSEAKAVMSGAGVPVVPGYHGEDQEAGRLAGEAAAVGFPLLVKAVAGGGGKGMKIAHTAVSGGARLWGWGWGAAGSVGLRIGGRSVWGLLG
jgi:3-methylcrotonyl-CoA carboxylase alpha subunit